MKHLSPVTVLVVALTALGCTEDPVSPGSSDVGQSIESATPALSLQGLAETTVEPRYIVAYNGKAPRKLSSAVESAGGVVDATYEKYGFAIVSGIDAVGAEEIAGLSGVISAEAEPMFKLPEPIIGGHQLADGAVSSNANPAAAGFFPIQWHLGAINVADAWAAGRTGSSAVTLAILDTGIDPDHVDLVGRVDMSRAAVFNHFDDPFIEFFFPGAPMISDIHFHGTHVASTASSNAFAAAGVTSETMIMPVKVCNVNGSCPGSFVFEGIAYAIENGADVINLSLGGGFDKADNPGLVAVINRMFNSAKRAGVTIVVSAGNSSADLDHIGSIFATYCDATHVICVSATGPSSAGNALFGPWSGVDDPAFFTNFGRSAISVAAPGGNSAGFVLAACSSKSLQISGCQAGTSFVVWVSGTSQAAPQVTGLAGLLVEDYGRNPGRIKSAIQKGADDLGPRGTDPFYGKGRINVAATLGVD